MSAVIFAVYSEEAAFRWMSSVVTMPPRNVQMHMPQKRLPVVSQQSNAVSGSCFPYPVQMTRPTLALGATLDPTSARQSHERIIL